MLGLQWLQVRKILLKWFFQLCRQPNVHLVSNRCSKFHYRKISRQSSRSHFQAEEIQAFAERFDPSNGTANYTTSYVIFYL
jgi:hypothetical protein